MILCKTPDQQLRSGGQARASLPLTAGTRGNLLMTLGDAMIPPAKGSYRTSARYEMDDRWLLLRGGDLDGNTWLGTAAVGNRVFCGSGPWTPREIYTVTAEVVVDDEGRSYNVAVPAFAPS